jgi:DMSO/TMAO reductase YedYZ molybdopterin-dependent catalytic subunit
MAQARVPLPAYTGPEANPHWNSVGSYAIFPQKSPLIVMTDQPTQLETPRAYFLDAITPNHAFFVRWHLTHHPLAVDLGSWRLRIEGHTHKPLALSMHDLLTRYPATSVVAVNQCSGNSRSLMQPRVAGSQWGHGAMGCARWTGVRVRDLLQAAGLKKGALQVQFAALDRGNGPVGFGSHRYLKSLPLEGDAYNDALIAYSMNDEPLPMLNGFPVRLVVPGYYSTYWVKALESLRVLEKPDDSFWMAKAYHIPDNPRGHTTPEAMAAGTQKMIPIHRMPVRSFLISPDGSSKLIAGMPVALRGIAFSGHAEIAKVEVSEDDGKTWQLTQLGESLGAYAFRIWRLMWTPRKAGSYTLQIRATDAKGNTQLDSPIWNAGGYLWNRIERQNFVVGGAA